MTIQQEEDTLVSVITDRVAALLDILGFSAAVSVSELEDSYIVDVSGDDLGILIGFHGETLRAFEHLIRRMVFDPEAAWKPLVIDIAGYRQKREESLRSLAQRSVEKVRYLHEPVSLSPMNSFERRIVHTVVGEYDDVYSESVGEEPERRVVIHSH